MFSSMRRTALCLAAITALAPLAIADGVKLLAQTDPDNPGSFVLEFTDFGYVASAIITSTEYELEVDADAGTARFLDYYQTAEALELPGGFDTGPLQIGIVPFSSSGTYDSGTGQFTTSEFYVIEFTGDLSAFGLTSPVYLPGASGGTVTFDGSASGHIASTWDGEGTLNNPSDPNNPLDFTYACQVGTEFTVEAGCTQSGCEGGDVNRDCLVDLDDLSIVLASFGEAGVAVTRAGGDLNYDGVVDLADLSAVLVLFANDCR